MTLLSERALELHRTGENVHAFATIGSLTCVGCGFAVAAAAVADDLPKCPACGGSRFRRTSIFEQPTVDADAVEAISAPPLWLREIRAEAKLEGCAPSLVFETPTGPRNTALPTGWTRVGRSAAADIRLDDPTVSRRHALVVRTAEDGLRALDDRSLNGLFVNGERVEWSPLDDGDELEVGRYRLFVVAP